MSLKQALAHADGNMTTKGIPTANLEKVMQEDSQAITARGLAGSRKTLEAAIADFAASTVSILDASNRMHAQADASSKQVKEAVSRAKGHAIGMADAMNRVTKMLGPDLESRIQQLERLTSAMERLADLQKTGLLDRVMSAMRSQQ